MGSEGARNPERQNHNEAGRTDRRLEGQKMGCLFIFMPLILLSTGAR